MRGAGSSIAAIPYSNLQFALEALARHNPITETAGPAESTDSHMQRRRRLAEPEEGSPRGHTAKEQREALRKACGLPHYDGDYAEYFRQIRGTQT
jgi:hypothetical protein